MGLGLVACSSHKPAPVAPERAAPAPTTEIAADTPDLSPVSAPPGLFGLGRVVRPLAISDAVLGWAGLPVGLRELLPERTRALDRAIAWEAPVEFALVLSGSTKHPVQAFFSVGLSSLEVARQLAAELGYETERLGPGIYAIGGVKGTSCAIAPALGSAAARLVCAERRSELEEVLPYATRGLPNESIGSHDLDFELRVEPVRQKFGTAISSARLFAGFLIPRVALDVPRFDGAVSDGAYALADEAVALVGDLDVLRVEGTVQRDKQLLELELALKFRSKKSFTAGVVEESAGRAGPPPAALFRLPAHATSGGFSYAVEPKRWDGVRRIVSELVDAYLEHEKIKTPLRDRARGLSETLFQIGYPVTVFAEGSAGASAPGEGPGSWSIFRSELPASKLRPALGDLHAILSDKTLRKSLSRRLESDDKALPVARLGRLSGPGIPAGTQLVTLSVPPDFNKELGERVGMSSAQGPAARKEYVIAVVADGTGSLVGVAPTSKELAARLGPVLSGKGPTLSDRPELAPLRDITASGARFTTLEALAAEVAAGSDELRRTLPTLPGHGRVPIVMKYTAELSPALTGRVRLTVPAGVFADIPGLLPLAVGSAFGGRLMKP